MFYFYLLQSLKNIKEIYTGSTSNLKARFAEHNHGNVPSTKRYSPWRLVYYEAFLSEKDARLREQGFKKHGKGNYELKKRLTYSLRKGEGFTLVEALIAITILVFAIVAPLTMASLGLHSAQFSKDYVVASYLAQEGIEYIRNTRDTNVLSGSSWLTTISGVCGGGDGCIVDGFLAPASSLAACSGTCSALLFDTSTGAYQHTSNANTITSPFTRTVKVTERVAGVEADVEVTVSWTSGTINRNVVAKTILFNWQEI